MSRATKAAPKPPPSPGLRYFRNLSPMGALLLPLTGDMVARGGLVAVRADRAERIASQDVWVEVDQAAALIELASPAPADDATPAAHQQDGDDSHLEDAANSQDEPPADESTDADGREA